MITEQKTQKEQAQKLEMTKNEIKHKKQNTGHTGKPKENPKEKDGYTKRTMNSNNGGMNSDKNRNSGRQ